METKVLVHHSMPDSTAQDRISGWCRRALRFFVPVECLTCGVTLGNDPVPFFCRNCWDRIVPLKKPSCACCDRPFASSVTTSWAPDHRCQDCLEQTPAYQRAWTLFPYVPPLQDAICALKYRGKVGLAGPLAQLMLSALSEHIDIDLVMPVPLHHSRLRSREFNQSLLLADRLGPRLGKPVSATGLVRVKRTDPQTTLSRPERLRNLRQAFAVPDPDTVAGRRILVVDDVFTTGATLNECADTLMLAGAESVYALTLARTVDTSLVPDRIFAGGASRTLPARGV